MRFLSATLIGVTCVVLASGAAFAAWKEYDYKDLGFVVDFPEPPTVSMGNYRTILVPSAPVHIYTLKQPDGIFVASVVDLQKRAAEGANLETEAEYRLTLLGDVSANEISRVEPGTSAVFGHFITIDCRHDKVPDQTGQNVASYTWLKAISGLECPDKARLTVNLLFNGGRMYIIQGLNLPAADGSTLSAASLRFTNSISLYQADGTRAKADSETDVSKR